MVVEVAVRVVKLEVVGGETGITTPKDVSPVGLHETKRSCVNMRLAEMMPDQAHQSKVLMTSLLPDLIITKVPPAPAF